MLNASNETGVIDPSYLMSADYAKVYLTILASISLVLGVPGNILVVLVHINIKDKLVTDWMIFYLAVCDLLSLAVLPNICIQVLGYWPIGFPDILCKLHLWHSNAVSMASYVFCACTAMERFVKVCLSKDLFSHRQTQFMWIPIGAFCYGLGIFSYITVGNNANGHCMIDKGNPTISAIAYGSVMVTALISSGVMVLCYLGIGLFLLRTMKELTASKTNDNFAKSYKNTIQMTKVLAIVTFVFLMSANIPYVTAFVAMFHRRLAEPFQTITFMLTMLFMVNNFFNPYLYLGMSTSFRLRALVVLRPCCRCLSKYTDTAKSTEASETKTTDMSTLESEAK